MLHLLTGHAVHLRAAYAVSGGAAAVLLAAGGYLLRRRRPDVEAMEARRRQYLFENGRIIDGTVLDIRDEPPADAAAADAAPRRLVFYKYRVAGVHYESSQDVTGLAEQMENATSTVGFPVSVRYDPANPLNSIVVCEQWLGMHHNPIQPRRPAASAQTIHAPGRLHARS